MRLYPKGYPKHGEFVRITTFKWDRSGPSLASDEQPLWGRSKHSRIHMYCGGHPERFDADDRLGTVCWSLSVDLDEWTVVTEDELPNQCL